MKILILILSAMTFTSAASADFTRLNEGDLSVQPISASYIEVSNQKVPCGPSCTGVTSAVKLSYPLVGCLDRLISFKTIEEKAGKVTVYVTALNVFTKASESVKCIVAPIVIDIIPLSGFYSSDDVEVIFVGVD